MLILIGEKIVQDLCQKSRDAGFTKGFVRMIYNA